MRDEFSRLHLDQLHAWASLYGNAISLSPPKRGWLHLIRTSLGRTQAQQGILASTSGSVIHKSEKAEVEERISLSNLRKHADAMDCDLVYALIPRRPIAKVVEQQARRVAMEQLSRNEVLRLEDGSPGYETAVDQCAHGLLNGRWSKLWRNVNSRDES